MYQLPQTHPLSQPDSTLSHSIFFPNSEPLEPPAPRNSEGGSTPSLALVMVRRRSSLGAGRRKRATNSPALRLNSTLSHTIFFLNSEPLEPPAPRSSEGGSAPSLALVMVRRRSSLAAGWRRVVVTTVS
ncbi:hypothetical protein JTE90_001743 [Oedothorax gibbosus]|uniref:Uncharacterized protein n=1 Tax=Oedothorax gibbosus TaxID=931172 RepID=A0AAV6V7V3_9ARAC|nr:hypothetical protein JTE90_001743 [Oedothorax gibbosus]